MSKKQNDPNMEPLIERGGKDQLPGSQDGVLERMPPSTKARKPRVKRPYLLEENFDIKGENRNSPIWRQVADSPDFPDTAAAHKWATEHNLPKADYRVVRVMSEFSVDTETVTKTVLKVK